MLSGEQRLPHMTLINLLLFVDLFFFFSSSATLDNTKALADPARWDVNSRSWRYQTCSQVSILFVMLCFVLFFCCNKILCLVMRAITDHYIRIIIPLSLTLSFT